VEPEKAQEERGVRSRRELEDFKSGERAYAKFEQETGAQDQEFEKELERLIEKGMAEGLQDEAILDRILTGGEQTLSRADVARLEQEKEDELLKEGLRVPELGPLFGDPAEAERFEAFQQRAGKMMFEEDQILLEKWTREERDKRIKEGAKPMPETKGASGKLYQSSKAKRNIEGTGTFGHVEETEDVSRLHKNSMGGEEALIKGNQEETIDSYFEGMGDEEFEKGLNKAMGKEIKRLKKEASRSLKLTD
jgi:hypothetical protein